MSFTPSLKSLRSFEAAARLESLTLAADELNVSVSAIALQVRQVETALGRKLLRRDGRGLSATAEAKALARDLGAAFGQVAAAVARCRAEGSGAVTVSMLPSFAALWLLPRLASFRAARPEVDFRILTSSRRVDLAAEPVDCAIRCGAGRWDGAEAVLLFEQRLAPLCSPAHAAAARDGGLAAAAEAELIVNARHEDEWTDWCAGHAIQWGRNASTGASSSPRRCSRGWASALWMSRSTPRRSRRAGWWRSDRRCRPDGDGVGER